MTRCSRQKSETQSVKTGTPHHLHLHHHHHHDHTHTTRYRFIHTAALRLNLAHIRMHTHTERGGREQAGRASKLQKEHFGHLQVDVGVMEEKDEQKEKKSGESAGGRTKHLLVLLASPKNVCTHGSHIQQQPPFPFPSPTSTIYTKNCHVS